jgi:hypothetical protein
MARFFGIGAQPGLHGIMHRVWPFERTTQFEGIEHEEKQDAGRGFKFVFKEL